MATASFTDGYIGASRRHRTYNLRKQDAKSYLQGGEGGEASA